MNQITIFFNSSHLVLILLLISSPAISAAPSPSPADRKTHFVLVHGACHGAWSWYKVSAILQSSAHTVTTLDMAASGTFHYFQPLTELLAALPSGERVVLVGHSFGGLGVALAMQNFPEKISAAVFVAATMPGPNLSVSAIRREAEKEPTPPLDSHYLYENGEAEPPTSYILGPQKLAEHLYPLSPSADLILAKELVRPLPMFEIEDSEFEFTEERYGCVKRAMVVTERDLTMTKKLQMWMIQKNPPHITLEIKGSDHMAMASKPLELAHQLQCIAHQLNLF